MRDGHTIILTTHYLEEAEALCGRIAMLKAGRIVALDSTQNLLSRFAGITCRVVASRMPAAWGARVVRRDGGVHYVGLDVLRRARVAARGVPRGRASRSTSWRSRRPISRTCSCGS